MKFEVTQDDIAKGEQRAACHCPIANAVYRTLGLKPIVSAHKLVLRLSHFYDLPENARQFISKFDKGEAVEPFSFELDVTRSLNQT